MMNIFKRMSALVLALIMCVSLVLPASAEEESRMPKGSTQSRTLPARASS